MDKFDEFMTNHWPHMVAEVATLKAQIKMGLALGVAILGVLIKGTFF